MLRGRWLSSGAMEEKIILAAVYIGKVFANIWGYYADDPIPELVPLPDKGTKPKAKVTRPNQSKDPGHQEEEEFARLCACHLAE